MDDIQRGKIKAFNGFWGSGLGALIIEQDDGGITQVHCENAATVRALGSCFGDVIGENHTAKEDAGFIGQEVFYSTDEVGVLNGFTPVNEATPEILEAWENSLKEESGLTEN